MKIANSVIDLIGHTPLMALNKIKQRYHLQANLLAKIEAMNPAGSAKDRIARQMILDAEEQGILKSDSVIIEPTSGNTGIGLASIASARGYRTILTMPETMSIERRNLLKAYGAELVLTEGAKGMQGAVDKAKELAREIPNSFFAGQFTNMSNPTAHYETTGPEIWEDTEGQVDVLVATFGTGGTISGTGRYLKEKNPNIHVVAYETTGPEIWEDTEGQVDVLVATFGTGGTISGTGRYLKEKNPNIHVVAVEPASSPLLSEGKFGPHKIQGIGANFIPETMDCNLPDEIITVTDEDAFAFGKEMARAEGVLVGISSGAALCAAVKVAERKEFFGKNVVVIFPDTGERYLSTVMFD